MKLGIMQPYFIPYLGYWQLMNAVDKYVIYDDVNFIKGGWINRNRILVNGQSKYFNIPMLGASSFKLINEVGVNKDTRLLNRNLKTIESAYKKAPYFEIIFPMMKDILECQEECLSKYIENSFYIINSYLDIDTQLIVSSSLQKDCKLRGQEKVISICRNLGATEYYNAIGGQELYSYEAFQKYNIRLYFLKTDRIEYKQFGEPFIPSLSIVDVMMFNSKERIKKMLNQFELIDEPNRN